MKKKIEQDPRRALNTDLIGDDRLNKLSAYLHLSTPCSDPRARARIHNRILFPRQRRETILDRNQPGLRSNYLCQPVTFPLSAFPFAALLPDLSFTVLVPRSRLDNLRHFRIRAFFPRSKDLFVSLSKFCLKPSYRGVISPRHFNGVVYARFRCWLLRKTVISGGRDGCSFIKLHYYYYSIDRKN